ncbi:hypothetical protein AAG906_028883 [Vitis piasezkii]
MVDTTTSFHITARRDFFSSYTSGNFGWVRMGNEAKCEIFGMGDVELETSIGCKLVMKDVERQIGKQLKSVRVDNGGEYRGPFEQYCRSHDIRLEKTIPKTQQQNGVAEKMNRTICDRIRCMFSHAKLSKVWIGKFVSFEHLRVFGCRAFVHVPRGEQSKLNKFGYRLWDLATKKIIRSRDVVFFEDQTIEDLDQFAVDDVEENPTIENDGLKQQQEQVISELPIET